MSEKFLRPLIFIFAAVLHLLIIFFLVFDMQKSVQEEPENARVMKLTDLDELPPPPPPPPPEPEREIPQVEAIAETMIETDVPPVQEVVAAGTIITVAPVIVQPEEEDYLPMHLVSKGPVFDERAILADLVYPPIALRSGIEGRVILELFVNRAGVVQSITILREEPEGRGFGEAAVRALMGRKGTPAMANNEPVSIRYRYPVSFTIK